MLLDRDDSIIINPFTEKEIDPNGKNSWCAYLKKKLERLPLSFVDDKINLSVDSVRGAENQKEKSFWKKYFLWLLLGSV